VERTRQVEDREVVLGKSGVRQRCATRDDRIREHTSTYVAFICHVFSPPLANEPIVGSAWDMEYRDGDLMPDFPPESFSNNVAAARGTTPGCTG
jgi:hypothetical protein